MNQPDFTTSDLRQIADHGLSIQEVQHQLMLFRRGAPFLPLDRACTLGEGITPLPAGAERDRLIALFEQACRQGRFSKFTPASGAATRMFKSLHTALARVRSGDRNLDAETQDFIVNLKDFAFYPCLRAQIQQSTGANLDKILCAPIPDPNWTEQILAALLDPDQLGFASLPKGLLPFHRRGETPVTAFEEHFTEAGAYAAAGDGKVRLHFTVTAEFMDHFERLAASLFVIYRENGLSADTTFSVQDPSTDTLAVDEHDCPFRAQDGRLIFRPGGHGALLKNLGDFGADLVFIKNIDNVAPERLLSEISLYKKILGGMLVDIQNRLFYYIEHLDNGPLSNRERGTIAAFINDQLGFALPDGFDMWPIERATALMVRILNRPVRVCGMVRNEGEPGGGPFWVHHADGARSLQVVESSQVDWSDEAQAQIARHAAFFNPVDLVCAMRDRHGTSFPLANFRDPEACFISHKSHQGRLLKALEIPGLWNGAMASWNTMFVEVPAITFNPVKTVMDLLRPQHRQ